MWASEPSNWRIWTHLGTDKPQSFKTRNKAMKYINHSIPLSRHYKKGYIKIVNENEVVAYIL